MITKDRYNRVTWTCARLYRELESYGLCPNKSARIQIPKLHPSVLPHFVRGLIDADGSFYRKGSGNLSDLLAFCHASANPSCMTCRPPCLNTLAWPLQWELRAGCRKTRRTEFGSSSTVTATPPDLATGSTGLRLRTPEESVSTRPGLLTKTGSCGVKPDRPRRREPPDEQVQCFDLGDPRVDRSRCPKERPWT